MQKQSDNEHSKKLQLSKERILFKFSFSQQCY